MRTAHDPSMGLSHALREERVRRGHSQAQAADEIGTSQPNVGRWESGQSIPDPPWYEPLMRYLSVDRATLGLYLLRSNELKHQRRGQRE